MTHAIAGMDDLSVIFMPDRQQYIVSNNDGKDVLTLSETEAIRLRHMLNFHLPRSDRED